MTELAPHRTHPDDPGEPSTGAARIGVTFAEADILARWAHNQRVCEIGTGLGFSTVAMAKTASEMTTVDIDPWVHRVIWPGLPKNVKKLSRKPDRLFQMIFIDGDHRPDMVRKDVLWAKAHAPRIVVHDWPEVKDAIADLGWWIPYTTRYGMAVLDQ